MAHSEHIHHVRARKQNHNKHARIKHRMHTVHKAYHRLKKRSDAGQHHVKKI